MLNSILKKLAHENFSLEFHLDQFQEKHDNLWKIHALRNQPDIKEDNNCACWDIEFEVKL